MLYPVVLQSRWEVNFVGIGDYDLGNLVGAYVSVVQFPAKALCRQVL